MAALLAMKAVRDLKLPLTKNVRLIAGTDEETGFRDIKWYYGSHPYAPHTLSPDADFPIINLEKGHYQPTFQAAWPQEIALPRVAAFSGGTRLNMVPPKAQATVLGLSPRQVEEAFQALALEGAVTCTCTQEGEALHVACAGQNAHGSTPEEGHNAQTALVALLAALPLADCPSTRAIRALHALFPHGDHRGTALGIAQADDLSGPLTLAFTMLTLNDTGCTGRFDSRTPLTATQASVQTVAEAALRAAGFAVQGDMDPPPLRAGERPLPPHPGPVLRGLHRPKRAVPGHRRRHLCPRHSRRSGLRAQHAGVRLQPPRARRKDPGGGPAHHRQDLCPSHGGTVPVSQAPF